MRPSIELVSFVTRAENRVEVLLALASEPATRREVQDDTDIPRATLSRILADFRDRDLATRERHRYRLTPLGELVATELGSLFESVESVRALQTLAHHLPLDDLGVEFERLATAEVTLPTRLDPMAPVKRAATVVGEADRMRTFCYSVLHAPILAALQGVARRGQRLEAVVAAGVLEVVAADPDLVDAARSLFEAGTVDLYRHDGGIEPQLILADGTTMFLVTDDEGAIQGLVETDDDALLPWARETFESLKADAEPLDPDAVAELLAP